MIEPAVLAGGLVGGIDWRRLTLVAGALWAPVPTAITLGVVMVMIHRSTVRAAAGREIRFVESVAGELRAGASLRAALCTSCGELPGAGAIVRRLEVGEPLDRAVAGLGDLLPSVGHLVESAVEVGAGGGPMLPIFEELMVHTAASAAALSELRTALAPVQASLVVLVGVPAAYLVWAAMTGRLARLLALPGGLGLTSLGALLFTGGLIVMLLLMRGSR